MASAYRDTYVARNVVNKKRHVCFDACRSRIEIEQVRVNQICAASFGHYIVFLTYLPACHDAYLYVMCIFDARYANSIRRYF